MAQPGLGPTLWWGIAQESEEQEGEDQDGEAMEE